MAEEVAPDKPEQQIELDPVERERKIRELKAELERIIAGYHEVEQRSIPEEAEFASKVEEIKQQRLASLLEYKKQEFEAAYKLREGMIYGIENDHERAADMVKMKIEKFIQAKMNFLLEELTDAAKYFESKRQNCPVLRELMKGREKEPFCSITRSNQPLLTAEEIEKCYIEILHSSDKYKVVIDGNGQYMLTSGADTYSVGSHAVMSVGSPNVHQGTISSVGPKQIGFASGSRTVQIPLSSLNMGFVQLAKQ